MKLSQPRIIPALLALALAPALTGCGVVNRIRARNALNEGTRAFKDGRFDEAEQKFRYAHDLDPAMTNAPFFIARAAHQQFKPGVESDENRQKAERAIAEYQKVLGTEGIEEKFKENSFNAIVMLYRQIKEEDTANDWLLKRARGEDNAPASKRADAYSVLASKKWDCSYAITELPENKETSKDKPGDSQYKIKDPAKYNEARQCVGEGLALVGEALKLEENNTTALAYQVNLMREQAKLAQSDGNKAEYDRLNAEADVIEKKQRELLDQRKAAEEAKKGPAAEG